MRAICLYGSLYYRGVKLAQSSSNKRLKIECAEILENLRVCLYICIYISIYLPIYLSIYLPIYISIYLSIYLFIHLSAVFRSWYVI